MLRLKDERAVSRISKTQLVTNYQIIKGKRSDLNNSMEVLRICLQNIRKSFERDIVSLKSLWIRSVVSLSFLLTL